MEPGVKSGYGKIWIGLIGLAGLLLCEGLSADRLDDALKATRQGNYTIAFSLWQRLAKQGDAIAQYNLAVFFNRGLGVQPSANDSNRWLKAAARQGLVEAYNKLQDDGVKPAGELKLHLVGSDQLILEPVAWVTSQNPGHYTLQLATSKNIRLIQKYFDENDLQGQAGYYRNLRQGEVWYSLVYGSYLSVRDAKASIKHLPLDLRKWSPWVRKIKEIHRVMDN